MTDREKDMLKEGNKGRTKERKRI